MSASNIMSEKRGIFQYFSCKIILGIMSLPLMMNVISVMMINLAHFNTFEGSRGEELIANILFYVGNWPTLLLNIYPYEVTTKSRLIKCINNSGDTDCPLTQVA